MEKGLVANRKLINDQNRKLNVFVLIAFRDWLQIRVGSRLLGKRMQLGKSGEAACSLCQRGQ